MDYDYKEESSLEKLEEFFEGEYKDKVYEVLEQYPDMRTLIVDFNDLDMFDHELAELLIKRPAKVIGACKKAIRSIDPLMKEAVLDIRFKNVSNVIDLKYLSSRMIGQFIKVRGSIGKVFDNGARMETATFECRGCLRMQEVAQALDNPLREPSICPECGGRSFKLSQDKSRFVDTQSAILDEMITNASPRYEPTELLIVCEGDLTNQLMEKDIVDLTGTLKIHEDVKTGDFSYYLYVNYIEFIEKWTPDIGAEDGENAENKFSKNNLEYKEWRNKVILRDNGACQCCGLDEKLEAHHIFSSEEYPQLAYELTNGITLCKFCHDKYHSIYGKGGSAPVKFIEFLRRFGNG